MRQKSNSSPASSETLVRNIRRATRKHHAAEEKIRIVLDGLRGETSIAELCRREGIAESMYYSWSKEFLEAGKRRLAGDTARAATTDEVKQLRREAQDLKEVVAEQALEDKPSKPDRVWNRIPADIRQRVVMMAFEQPELSPRELATRFTDTNSYYVSESSVYRLLKAHDLIRRVQGQDDCAQPALAD